MAKHKCRKCLRSFFTYQTRKVVNIKSLTIGFISRFVQLLIIGYIVGYVIIYKKGYQEYSDVQSEISAKVRGAIYTNFAMDEFDPRISHPEIYNRLWDPIDLVVPTTENNAFFIATNAIIARNQKRGTCPEDTDVRESICDPKNNHCVKFNRTMYSNGVQTGNCIPSKSGTAHTCEIFSWCPLIDEIWPLKDKTKGLLAASENFTVLIKNVVSFPKFGNLIRRNIKHLRDHVSSAYLRNCTYDADKHKGCPRFTLGEIARLAKTNFKEMAPNGGIIIIMISWDCNLDFSADKCFPTYRFYRGDSPKDKMFSGWNFRYAHYYDNGRRTLYKMFGIKFIFNVHGHAGRFNLKPLLLHLGAGLGLLAIQVIVCDILVLYVLRARKYYQEKKYEDVFEPGDSVIAIGTLSSSRLRGSSRLSVVKRTSSFKK